MSSSQINTITTDLRQSNLAKKLEKKKLYGTKTADAIDSNITASTATKPFPVNLVGIIGTSLKFPKLNANK